MNIQVVRKFPQIKSKVLLSQHNIVVIPRRKSTNFASTAQTLQLFQTNSLKCSKWIDVQTQKSLLSPQRFFSTSLQQSTKSSDSLDDLTQNTKVGPRLRERLGKPIVVDDYIEALDKFFSEFCTPKDLGYRWKTWDPKKHTVQQSHGLQKPEDIKPDTLMLETAMYDAYASELNSGREDDEEEDPDEEIPANTAVEELDFKGKEDWVRSFGRNYTKWKSAYNYIFPEQLESHLDLVKKASVSRLKEKLYPHDDRHTFPFGIIPIAIHKENRSIQVTNFDILRSLEDLAEKDIATIKETLAPLTVAPDLSRLEKVEEETSKPVPNMFTKEVREEMLEYALFTMQKDPILWPHVQHLANVPRQNRDFETSKLPYEVQAAIRDHIYGGKLSQIALVGLFLSTQRQNDVLYLLYRSLSGLHVEEIETKILNLKPRDKLIFKREFTPFYRKYMEAEKARHSDDPAFAETMKLYEEINALPTDKKSEKLASLSDSQKKSLNFFPRQFLGDFYRNLTSCMAVPEENYEVLDLVENEQLCSSILLLTSKTAYKYPFILDYIFSEWEDIYRWQLKYKDRFEKHYREYNDKIFRARERNDRKAYARLQEELDQCLREEAAILLKRMERDVDATTFGLDVDESEVLFEPKEIRAEALKKFEALNSESQLEVQKYFVAVADLVFSAYYGQDLQSKIDALKLESPTNMREVANHLQVTALFSENFAYVYLFDFIRKNQDSNYRQEQTFFFKYPNLLVDYFFSLPKDNILRQNALEMVTLPRDKRNTRWIPMDKLLLLTEFTQIPFQYSYEYEPFQDLHAQRRKTIHDTMSDPSIVRQERAIDDIHSLLGKVSSDTVEHKIKESKLELPVQLLRNANEIVLAYNSMIEQKNQMMSAWEEKANIFTSKVETSYPKIWSKVQAMRGTLGKRLQQILKPRELLFGILLRETQVGDELVQPLKDVLSKLSVQDLEEYVKLAEELEACHTFLFENSLRYTLQLRATTYSKVSEEEAAGEQAIRAADKLSKDFIKGLKSHIEKVKKAQETKEISPDLLNQDIDEILHTLSLRETVERLAKSMTIENSTEIKDYDEFKTAVLYHDHGILSIRRFRTYFINPNALSYRLNEEESEDSNEDPASQMIELLKDEFKATRLVDWYKAYLSAKTLGGDAEKEIQEFTELTGLQFNSQFVNAILDYVQTRHLPNPEIAPDSVNYHTIHKITEYGHVYIDIQNVKLPPSWLGAFKSVQWPNFMAVPFSEYTQPDQEN